METRSKSDFNIFCSFYDLIKGILRRLQKLKIEFALENKSGIIGLHPYWRRYFSAHLYDGRTISVPLAWSWRLSEATHEQREHYEIIGDGQGVHWPEIDEDISAEGMLYGSPTPKPFAVV